MNETINVIRDVILKANTMRRQLDPDDPMIDSLDY